MAENSHSDCSKHVQHKLQPAHTHTHTHGRKHTHANTHTHVHIHAHTYTLTHLKNLICHMQHTWKSRHVTCNTPEHHCMSHATHLKIFVCHMQYTWTHCMSHTTHLKIIVYQIYHLRVFVYNTHCCKTTHVLTKHQTDNYLLYNLLFHHPVHPDHQECPNHHLFVHANTFTKRR